MWMYEALKKSTNDETTIAFYLLKMEKKLF